MISSYHISKRQRCCSAHRLELDIVNGFGLDKRGDEVSRSLCQGCFYDDFRYATNSFTTLPCFKIGLLSSYVSSTN